MKAHNGNTLWLTALPNWVGTTVKSKFKGSDLGKSGQTVAGRNDFHRLMAAVGLGEVGAVLALVASRFSRSQADWHKLIDICALTDTLVIDHDGIYDPNDFNDRVLLGFKGTWSHTELHGMRLRLQGAKLQHCPKKVNSVVPRQQATFTTLRAS